MSDSLQTVSKPRFSICWIFFLTCFAAKHSYYKTAIKLEKYKKEMYSNFAFFLSNAFLILLKLLIFALAVL